MLSTKLRTRAEKGGLLGVVSVGLVVVEEGGRTPVGLAPLRGRVERGWSCWGIVWFDEVG